MKKMRHLLLLGAGHAHIYLLQNLATMAKNAQLPPLKISLVSPHANTYYSGMIPGFIAGHYHLEECAIHIPALLKNSDIQWYPCHAEAIDLAAKKVLLDNHEYLSFDLLSIDTGAGLDQHLLEQRLPGASTYGISLRPLETLAQKWPDIVQSLTNKSISSRSEPMKAPIISVVGGGAAAFEIACSLANRFPTASLHLFSGLQGVGANYPRNVQLAMLKQLQHLGIELHTQKVFKLHAQSIEVGESDSNNILETNNKKSKLTMVSHMTWLAMGSMAPAWLKNSGLALDAQGFIQVNCFQQSVSCSDVFAAGDVASRIDQDHPRSGVYAVRAGPALARNIILYLKGETLIPHQLPSTTLNLLACGRTYGIANYGSYCLQGSWVWHWKNWIDRRFMKKHQAL